MCSPACWQQVASSGGAVAWGTDSHARLGSRRKHPGGLRVNGAAAATAARSHPQASPEQPACAHAFDHRGTLRTVQFHDLRQIHDWQSHECNGTRHDLRVCDAHGQYRLWRGRLRNLSSAQAYRIVAPTLVGLHQLLLFYD